MSGRVGAYTLSPLAEADLEEIWLYSFKKWSVEQADRYHNEIIDMIQELAAGVRGGRTVASHPEYLKCAVGSHFIFYRRTNRSLIVVRILHKMMDVERYL